MDRNNTTFQSELYAALKKALDSGELSDKLFYYQQIAVYYAAMAKTGFYLWHDMGLGKTLAAIAISSALFAQGYKIIVLTPKSLQQNFKNGIADYNKTMADTPNFKPANIEDFNFVVKSATVNKNIAKIMDPGQVFEDDRTPVKINKITRKTIFIIDEAHQISQSIANGSNIWGEFYELIMRSPLAKVIMLSGSLFNSDPFELVPICNMLAGQQLFPERHDDFMTLFWDRHEKRMINRGAFQNRIYGLFSRMELSYLEANTLHFYPEQKETQLVRCPMGKYQFDTYMLARSKELQEKRAGVKSVKPVVKKFETPNKDSSTYRVESRKCSNFAPPPNLIARDDQPKTIAETKRVLAEVMSDYFAATKIKELHKIVHAHKGQKGLIYSQFVGIGGACPVAESFNRAGYEEYSAKNKSDAPKYAVVNGGLSLDEQAKIMSVYDDASNDGAEKIHFLIIGVQQTNGLDCKCVRFIVMLEPFWKWSLWDQLVKRGVRYKSHERLPEDQRNVTPYILMSVYPENVDEKVLLTPGMRKTTDESLYSQMLYDKDRSEEFKKPITEVAIECLFVKDRNPQHVCRVCAPNNKKLFTEGVDALQALRYDCSKADPCDLSAKEEVKAIRITYNKSVYYAVPDDDSKYGYAIYFQVGTEYEELSAASPIFPEIIKILQKK